MVYQKAIGYTFLNVNLLKGVNIMKNKITIKSNPSYQEKDNRIMELSFYNSQGEYKGLLMSLRFFEDKPMINLYRIDEGITIGVSKIRE